MRQVQWTKEEAVSAGDRWDKNQGLLLQSQQVQKILVHFLLGIYTRKIYIWLLQKQSMLITKYEKAHRERDRDGDAFQKVIPDTF